jgi:hypothetical protein
METWLSKKCPVRSIFLRTGVPEGNRPGISCVLAQTEQAPESVNQVDNTTKMQILILII